ncbi:WecB/TagA/CpsF family glycosyltransferase [Kamptonema animale CS-326]|jgi:N-acetylglucosaminyldiphosphoundecaprenol N-acetyl-beta-D-mannosaminyltransferase|uniref:WecB/TagA/CpsF family glycosyltransferase n=1 Tax=Kamptonema animale TaxID=92934 RepID=UPI00232FADE9|nr:WecB/TagA/CpsF family glycosyltransferase [Kamptonema animale]MDB9510096.1 WecB/TagA/CpsF family glycosyltransferase [Kamptonema animale CS-326]
MKMINVLNVSIHNFSAAELLRRLKREGGVVFTTNVDHLMKLQKDRAFFQAYQGANYRVCDSKIVMYASKFLGSPLQEKISGSDFFPAFYNYYKDDKDVTIFLLGAAEGVAEKAMLEINAKVGRNIVIASHSPSFGFENNVEECHKIIDLIKQSGATVLAIGVGSPKQEIWIHQYKEQLKNIKVFLGIGATIDFEAGCRNRAPKWMSEVGLEWFHRLLSEPQRLWKRYLLEGLPFFWLILQQKLNIYKTPFVNSPEFVEPDSENVPSPNTQVTEACLIAEAQLAKQNTSKPIGQILQEAGLISSEQVAAVLQEQAEDNYRLRFGEILARRGWIKPETIDFFADHLPNLAETKEKKPLGQYLKSAALLDDDQITTLLIEQRQTRKRFGEMAVHNGWLKAETIEWFLKYVAPAKSLSVV